MHGLEKEASEEILAVVTPATALSNVNYKEKRSNGKTAHECRVRAGEEEGEETGQGAVRRGRFRSVMTMID